MVLRRDVVEEFLRQGQWSPTGDDDAKNETLTQDLLRRLIDEYKAHPGDPSGQSALGLFVLALGIAEWGVRDPAGLPADPHGTNWASDSSAQSGKHLMSYSVGGLGIFHTDGNEMIEFIRTICQFPQITEAQKNDLLATVAANRYKDQKVTFDQLRASGVCRPETSLRGRDIFGEDFRHHDVGGGAKYCLRFFKSPKLTAHDWVVFKTWARIALRKMEIQLLLIQKWLDTYWLKTLRQLAPGDGFEEEAFINVRFRNSFSGSASNTTSPPNSSAPERIALQMHAYRLKGQERVLRRVNIIQRPVVLYRAFMGKPQLPKFMF